MKDNISTQKVKRGYLNEDFLFFNLKDQKKNDFEIHYHDFNKIIIFVSGEVTYIIEGKSYKLKPWDILLVGKNDLHLPIISPTVPYIRMILWLNPLFLEGHNKNNCDLLSCFQLASERKLNLIRLCNKNINSLKQNLADLEEEMQDMAFGSTILKNALFLQFMVKINRLFLGMDIDKNIDDIKYDPRIENILSFLNSNLDKHLSIGMLSKEFYLNKYYLMHLFKEETGYTIYNYIQKKRIIKASDLIKSGMQTGEVCGQCGFGDYSSFVRAFKKEFGLSPKQYYKSNI
ncbi:AraC family transcriptional regulator [Clostridium tagluense]|uniref:AraC family transcriptional regulator n=1 Tax=Clostridium tagluense TaxID=360422 RepID=UPI001CF16ED4|nr:AraC family transcriptional regulator [Clostridium tagluense]MCB2312585.1 AraC family transcriptional regulator [Clostridium tagluense]MCB2317261.1 AraC family transcriptional regulator [Clostridium tagluense]MCB2322126.1 AraC family transcriptional regulator [Clostridium tagluense]MCB2327057.1 AraC family transcriptional regulator [Clostridium tagluense]MCB2331775.1 AraC family transcriptional regulator [Clostridium tagluense]